MPQSLRNQWKGWEPEGKWGARTRSRGLSADWGEWAALRPVLGHVSQWCQLSWEDFPRALGPPEGGHPLAPYPRFKCFPSNSLMAVWGCPVCRRVSVRLSCRGRAPRVVVCGNPCLGAHRVLASKTAMSFGS